VKKGGFRLDGTTLVELLVAVVFIGICVSSIVSCVTNAAARAVYARRRILMLGQARSAIESSRSTARTTALTTGAPIFILSGIAGFTGTATMTKTTTLVSGYTNLYKVNVTINWTEKALGINRPDSIVMETWMRAPDA
jgi:type II secretory pathway pseudopilin PulG